MIVRSWRPLLSQLSSRIELDLTRLTLVGYLNSLYYQLETLPVLPLFDYLPTPHVSIFLEFPLTFSDLNR